jgi:small redox-active disulfide protein 2
MKVQVFGMGCASCKILLENAQAAVKESGVNAEVIKVDDMIEIIESGILATPGLAIDGKVKSMGRVPRKEEIIDWIKENR